MLREEGNIKMDFKEIRFDVSSTPFLLLSKKFMLCDSFTYVDAFAFVLLEDLL